MLPLCIKRSIYETNRVYIIDLTIILTGCKTGNNNKNDKENKTAVENRFEKKMKVMKILSKSLAGRFLLDILMRRKMSMNMMEKM